MPEPIDPEAFRDFEYAGWQRFAHTHTFAYVHCVEIPMPAVLACAIKPQ